uniref:collagen alpha-1(I) chain-like n=1 Tax=Nyctereutes procyonoides TaxID=34880 RepID=UPI0024439198|nr:collagen alpha-1(I) chain-like [Nyctereutes procyonoides]
MTLILKDGTSGKETKEGYDRGSNRETATPRHLICPCVEHRGQQGAPQHRRRPRRGGGEPGEQEQAPASRLRGRNEAEPLRPLRRWCRSRARVSGAEEDAALRHPAPPGAAPHNRLSGFAARPPAPRRVLGPGARVGARLLPGVAPPPARVQGPGAQAGGAVASARGQSGRAGSASFPSPPAPHASCRREAGRRQSALGLHGARPAVLRQRRAEPGGAARAASREPRAPGPPLSGSVRPGSAALGGRARARSGR